VSDEAIGGYLDGRTVLVTGAGGSIGSEIVRQVARHRARRLVLLGRGENSVFGIERELEHAYPELEVTSVILNVQDPKLGRVFERCRPDVVFHAAAHKHVPFMEANPAEAVLNNVFGTRNVAELCLAHGVERFVNVSTDKAVNPTSIMGASKRVAEMVVSEAAGRTGSRQDFVSVRFGNVLGSRGSVVPLFLDQIRRGGPVTVTSPEMRRYFMTIPEAAQLVLQAGGLATNGCVYVLDMGEPVRIADLAANLIRLSGAKDIEVRYTGPRPGEKLYEELLSDRETSLSTAHEKIFVAPVQAPESGQLGHLLDRLKEAALVDEPAGVRQTLKSLVPEYAPAWQQPDAVDATFGD
jgi:FlaA1/EpsC-like NDP-sugar epimerase